MKYRVDVENQPRRIFADAAAAIAYGASKTYLHSGYVAPFVARLESGDKVAWAYGFASVEAAPHCERCGEDFPPGCRGAQHGNRGCRLNNPAI